MLHTPTTNLLNASCSRRFPRRLLLQLQLLSWIGLGTGITTTTTTAIATATATTTATVGTTGQDEARQLVDDRVFVHEVVQAVGISQRLERLRWCLVKHTAHDRSSEIGLFNQRCSGDAALFAQLPQLLRALGVDR